MRVILCPMVSITLKRPGGSHVPSAALRDDGSHLSTPLASGMSALDLAPLSASITASWSVRTPGSEAIEDRTAQSYSVEIERIVDGRYLCSVVADGEVIGMVDEVATTLVGTAAQVTRAINRDAERRFE